MSGDDTLKRVPDGSVRGALGDGGGRSSHQHGESREELHGFYGGMEGGIQNGSEEKWEDSDST